MAMAVGAELSVSAVTCTPSQAARSTPCCAALHFRKLQHKNTAFNALRLKSSSVQRRGLRCRAVPVQSVLEETALPADYVRYETMIILTPGLTDEERDVELAKFEAFLNNEECKEVNALLRGRQPLAYPMNGHWEGIYVLYTYAAHAKVSQGVQKLLSAPSVGAENVILRHMTFRQ